MGSADEVNIQATELNRTMKVSHPRDACILSCFCAHRLLSGLCRCLRYPKQPGTWCCATSLKLWCHQLSP